MRRRWRVACCCRGPVSDFWGVQGLWDTIYFGGRISVVDQPLFGGWGLSVYGAGAAGFCLTARDGDGVSGGLRRVGNRVGARERGAGTDGKCVWFCVYAGFIVLLELSGGARSFLAILWGFARPPGAGVLFCGVCGGRCGSSLVGQLLPSETKAPRIVFEVI